MTRSNEKNNGDLDKIFPYGDDTHDKALAADISKPLGYQRQIYAA